MPVYATSDDLSSWTGAAAPSNAVQLLRTASLAVQEATQTAFYAVDEADAPTDATVIAAFRDATCAQAAAMIAQAVDPLAGGTYSSDGVEQSVGIGTARVQFADAAEAIEAQQQLLQGLCPEAQRILRLAGIQVGVAWVAG